MEQWLTPLNKDFMQHVTTGRAPHAAARLNSVLRGLKDLYLGKAMQHNRGFTTPILKQSHFMSPFFFFFILSLSANSTIERFITGLTLRHQNIRTAGATCYFYTVVNPAVLETPKNTASLNPTFYY